MNENIYCYTKFKNDNRELNHFECQIKVIENPPYIIAIITDKIGNKFKGVAKCMPEDEFDFNKGLTIAFLKADIKYKKKYLNLLSKSLV